MPSIYEGLPQDFYDESLRSSNPVTRHYHGSRYAKIRRFLESRYSDGMEVLDLGCGSANWNSGKLPLIGIDGNRAMLEHGKSEGRIGRAIVADISRAPLPLEQESSDIIIISEVLEHMENPAALLREARRILRAGGFLIVTVPLDTPFSAWSVLFGLNCFLRGDLLGNEYYRKRCGHIRHFSEKSITAMLGSAGFSVVEKDISLLNIAIVAKKVDSDG